MLYVKGLPQDLLGRKFINYKNGQEILDEGLEVSGLYPFDKSYNEYYQDQIEF